MVDPIGQPGVNPEQDLSVPINWAYNHHYSMNIMGNCSTKRMIENPDPQDTSNHGGPKLSEIVDSLCAAERADPAIPTHQWFSEGNGGESRKVGRGMVWKGAVCVLADTA